MTDSARQASFFSLTHGSLDAGSTVVNRVEIPIFQRDYAQGRTGDSVGQIREDFLDVLHAAVTGGERDAVGLDFVYGGIDSGTLRPLDGQQRLTTLFLLHWYVSSRAGHLKDDGGWKQFSYATRQSARMFCERLVLHALPPAIPGGPAPSSWIADQPWYLFAWDHDPTVQSMLVMIDAIDEQFHDVDPQHAWMRLTDKQAPAVSFLLLPLSELGGSSGNDTKPEDLYIKMNSRGKPLTPFENFKAHFEKTIQGSDRAADFALAVDTEWSDMLWEVRGDDDLIDDEFLRYIEFVTEVCEWRDGRTDGAGGRLGVRASGVFGTGNPRRDEHLGFLFRAFDVWGENDPVEVFNGFFNAAGDSDPERVRLFFRPDGTPDDKVNLFEACCRGYGEVRRGGRVFSLGQGLLLYAVIVHLTEQTDDFSRRVRILRNLIEASSDRIRPKDMPEILKDVDRVVRDGAVDKVTTLNQAQVHDERRKADFLELHPTLRDELFNLEDHNVLHGFLGAFELDAERFAARAAAFRQVIAATDIWPGLTGAILATGAYQRQRANRPSFMFGTGLVKYRNAWRELLTGATHDALTATRDVLGTFLDRVGESDVALAETYSAATAEFLERCERAQEFDWRYYMVKYPVMRADGSSTYVAEGGTQAEMGYLLCKLKANGTALNGYYHDPYLTAVINELDDSTVVEDRWFTGPATTPRRLPLARSGTAVRCVPAGFELTGPSADEFATSFDDACKELGVNTDGLVVVPQADLAGRPVDTVDRVRRGADIVALLVTYGL